VFLFHSFDLGPSRCLTSRCLTPCLTRSFHFLLSLSLSLSLSPFPYRNIFTISVGLFPFCDFSMLVLHSLFCCALKLPLHQDTPPLPASRPHPPLWLNSHKTAGPYFYEVYASKVINGQVQILKIQLAPQFTMYNNHSAGFLRKSTRQFAKK